MRILFPRYYQIFRQKGSEWLVHGSNLADRESVEIKNLADYGLNIEQLISELFKIRVGSEGYYIVNLRDKEYYYCGLTLKDVRTKLLELGVGRSASPEV